MLSSMRSRRRFILASVKFLSRALTALNFDPSMATLAVLNRSSLRHSAMNSRHTLRMAAPLSLRKSAMVLKSGASCPVSQITSMLRWHSRSSRRLDGTRLAAKQLRFHLDHRLLGVSPGAVGMLLWWKVSFEDRFQHQHRCCHADPIPQGRDAQRPEFAVGLRYVHSSDGVRSVSLLPERKRQFAKPPLHPVRLDVREVLPVHARCALVGAALGKGVGQDVLAANLVVQGIEPIAGFCLRFRVQRRLQFLNTLRS